MSIYKHKSGYRLDFRVNAPTRGEKPIRISRVYSTKSETAHVEKQLNEQLARARVRGRSLPNQTVTLAQVMADWFTESQELVNKGAKQRHLAKDSQQENSRRKKWSESHLGECRFVDLDFQHLESYIDYQRDESPRVH